MHLPEHVSPNGFDVCEKLFGEVQKLQRMVWEVGAHRQKNQTRSGDVHHRGLYANLLGTASAINLHASQLLRCDTDDLSANDFLTRKERNRLEQMVWFAEALLKNAGYASYTGDVRSIHDLARDAYHDTFRNTTSPEAVRALYVFLDQHAKRLGGKEYDHLDILTFRRNLGELLAIPNAKAHLLPVNALPLLKQFATWNFDLVSWNKDRARFLWEDVCAEGRDLLSTYALIVDLQEKGNMLERKTVDSLQRLQQGASALVQTINRLMSRITKEDEEMLAVPIRECLANLRAAASDPARLIAVFAEEKLQKLMPRVEPVVVQEGEEPPSEWENVADEATPAASIPAQPPAPVQPARTGTEAEPNTRKKRVRRSRSQPTSTGSSPQSHPKAPPPAPSADPPPVDSPKRGPLQDRCDEAPRQE